MVTVEDQRDPANAAQPPAESSRPLEDLTVLDLTVALAGPFATLLLAGLGARVIKVENPLGPDTSRGNPPYLGRTGVKLARESSDDISLASIDRLRNKLGITLNLKHPGARAVFADLAREADVVVENYSHGTLDRLGVGYDFTRRVNPALVYCSISGFGAEGEPGAGKAMDTIIQALSGIMLASGGPADPPIRVGLPVADLLAPLFAVIGILAAVNQARRTGEGQQVDVSMLGAVTSLLATESWHALARCGVPPRTGQTVPRLAPFGTYRAADGYVAICGPTDAFARGLFAAMGEPALADDERFRTRDLRVENAAVLDEMIERWTSALPRAEVLARLHAVGVPAAEVRDPRAAVADPRVIRRGETVRLTHPLYGEVDEVYGFGLPIRFSNATVSLDQPPPELGQHNDLVYGGMLGYAPARLQQLRADGVI